MKSGKFIVFEGIDGAGKSTQVALLYERLVEMGRKVVLQAEPTTLESGRAIRRALSQETPKSDYELAVMFVLDRIAHNEDSENGIEAVLATGADIICDRYYYSTLAYQGQTTSYEWTRQMNLGCPHIRRPDLCIYLDLTSEQSLERIEARGEAIEIYENIERLSATRNAFLSVIEDLRADGEKIFVVDAARTPDEIAHDIFEIIKNNIL